MMSRIIGIVGGVGTYAGIDLITKIADNTGAIKDQEHLPVAMLSLPETIPDRSEYLFGEVDENPGYAIAEVVKKLHGLGACVYGIPCNTAHAPDILKPVLEVVPPGCTLVNMIQEVAEYISQGYPDVVNVGIMGTNGVYKSRVYDDYMSAAGLKTVYPDEEAQYSLVHPAIYDMEYGIKAVSKPVSEKARLDLLTVLRALIYEGAQAVVLGCSEIPLAIREKVIEYVPIIDANDVLAKAIVREAKAEAKAEDEDEAKAKAKGER
ncbi:MAG: aspartate/glutamate racemase family protein [Bacteroidales bacterium]|nr:aspartate/glutamate racemase family protein [Bacteroidales bacterium]